MLGWRWRILRDHLSKGTEFNGDRLSRSINFMGIVCPGGQEVGDQKSGDQIGSRLNVSQPSKSTTVWNLKMIFNFRWGRRRYLRRWWGWAPFLPPSGRYRKIRSNWNCCSWTWMWITRCPWNLCLHSKRTLFYQMGNSVQSKILFTAH